MTARTYQRLILPAALVALAACGDRAPVASPPRPVPPSAKPTASPSVKAPAPLQTRWVLYLADAGAEEPRVLYRARLDGSERTRIALKTDRHTGFAQTRDGRFVAAWSDGFIRVMPATSSAFTTIVEEKRKDHHIRGVVWSGDDEQLAYVVTHELDPGNPAGAQDNSLFVVARSGGAPRLIRSFRDPAHVVLVDFDAAGKTLWWFETGEGGFHRNFSAVDLSDGSVRVLPGAPGGEISGVQMTPDHARAYSVSENRLRVTEYTLATGETRTVYEVADPGKDKHGNPTGIMRAALSADGARMALSVYNEPSNKEITYTLSLPEGVATVLVDEEKLFNVGAQSLSPEGRYVWLETDCHGCGDESGYNNQGEYYVKDVSGGKTHTFMRFPRQNGIAEQGIRLVGWLAG